MISKDHSGLSLNHSVIVLTEEDVPGAKFKHPNVENHSVVELKRWLQCRGLKKTGNKKELIERCLSCISAGRGEIIDVAVDEGKWFDLKLSRPSTSTCEAEASLVPVPGMSTTDNFSSNGDFQSFPSVDIPSFFNRGHIYHYLVENTSLAVQTDTATYEKSLKRGEQYVDSDHVINLVDCYEEHFYKIKGKVRASFKNIFYNVSANLLKYSGTIASGTCECKASELGKCSHVAALLLFILKHIEVYGYKRLTATSKPCEWRNRSRSRTPNRIIDADYTSVINRSRRASFDPRAMEDRKNEAADADINRFLSILDKSNTNTNWHEILNYKYEDFVLNVEEIQTLKIQIEQFKSNLQEYVQSKPQNTFVVEDTENQATSYVWRKWRSILITSSKAHQLLGLKSPAAKKNFLKTHIWNIDPVMTTAMKYGIDNEAEARHLYQICLSQNYADAHITTTGLWMSKKYPSFGCSPDGLIFRNGHRGILEIKCPRTLQHVHPADFDVGLMENQLKQFYLRKDDDGNITLKKNHSYFTQIQMTMAITETEFCVFYVWSPKGTLAIEVEFDEEFWNNIWPELEKRYYQIIVPEYFLMKAPRELNPIIL